MGPLGAAYKLSFLPEFEATLGATYKLSFLPELLLPKSGKNDNLYVKSTR